MPSTTSVYVSAVLLSSIVITPSAVTFSIASAISSPTNSSPAEIVATLAISLLPFTFFEFSLIIVTAVLTALFIPFFRTIGLAPAATFFMPSLIIACDRSVAVVVPSPATSFVFVDTSLISCAPRFSNLSSSSISLAIVTPSLVISGDPYFLSNTTLRPLGPNVIFTVFASLSTPDCKAFLASSPYKIFVAILLSSYYSIIAKTSDILIITYSTSSSFTSEPEYLFTTTLSPMDTAI